MLSFEDFFTACVGLWRTERTYHYLDQDRVERSFTEFQVSSLSAEAKAAVLKAAAQSTETLAGQIQLAPATIADAHRSPGFTIAFDTRSEIGETLSMSLRALFLPDDTLVNPAQVNLPRPLPIAAQVTPAETLIQGFYLRDVGYSEQGAIAGRFTYQPLRRTLEMTTYYRRSVAVDQMRLVSPNLRLRTIVTYQQPSADVDPDQPPSEITLVGFGVEHKH